jgi:hypothetical protein
MLHASLLQFCCQHKTLHQINFKQALKLHRFIESILRQGWKFYCFIAFQVTSLAYVNTLKNKNVKVSDEANSVAEPEPREPYHFDPRRTGTVSLL